MAEAGGNVIPATTAIRGLASRVLAAVVHIAEAAQKPLPVSGSHDDNPAERTITRKESDG
jgi:hypothetical protein